MIDIQETLRFRNDKEEAKALRLFGFLAVSQYMLTKNLDIPALLDSENPIFQDMVSLHDYLLTTRRLEELGELDE